MQGRFDIFSILEDWTLNEEIGICVSVCQLHLAFCISCLSWPLGAFVPESVQASSVTVSVLNVQQSQRGILLNSCHSFSNWEFKSSSLQPLRI